MGFKRSWVQIPPARYLFPHFKVMAPCLRKLPESGARTHRTPKHFVRNTATGSHFISRQLWSATRPGVALGTKWVSFAFVRVFPKPPRYDAAGVMIRSAIFRATILIVGTILGFADSSDNHDRTVRLNQASLDYARKLISEGQIVNDKHGDWSAHKPSAEDENEFIRQHGSEEYGRWYLGIDESHRSGSKACYKFPFGDFKNVHRCALIAVQNRARQYGYRDIETAAAELLELVEQKR
jgi:hypothetical protein